MKLALHFNGLHPDLGYAYGRAARRLVFPGLLDQRGTHVVSTVFVGDLLFGSIDTSRDGRHGSFSRPDLEYSDVVEFWLRPQNPVWARLSEERLTPALGQVFAICLESVDQRVAERLHEGLVDAASYLGAMEVDDGSFIHWQLYSKNLIPLFRVVGHGAQVFWDGLSEDGMDRAFFEEVQSLGFDPVRWESLNARFSIFDHYHDFEHAQRVAEWKRDCGRMLGFIADSVVSGLGDVVPDLGDRLWSALRTFDQAETTEQLSQVATTCRRIIEHVADRLFPPRETPTGGRQLGRKHYRNRLLAFADQERRTDSSLDLVCASTDALNEQITALLAVTQKGVHADVYRTETRRCLLRTILLLDDLVVLKQASADRTPAVGRRKGIADATGESSMTS